MPSSLFSHGCCSLRAQARAQVNMADISAFDDIWGFEAKKACFDAWDPEKPRDYDNFNPFERNDEGAMCDFNGCFPGQSRGYKSPNRPDQSWDIMQKEKALMEELAKEPKTAIKQKAKEARASVMVLGFEGFRMPRSALQWVLIAGFSAFFKKKKTPNAPP